MGKAPQEQKKMTFEKALAKLESLVERIESGEVPLEESIEKYAEGTKLIQQCRRILDAAEQKIQLLAKGEAGEAEPAGELAEPADE